MNRVSTGAGLCALAAAVAGFPIINQLVGQQQAAQASPVLASAVSAAVMAQAEPTIVWYGVTGATYYSDTYQVVLRAWSDGRLEAVMGRMVCTVNGPRWDVYQGNDACRQWTVISDSAAGLAAKADINSDLAVDGKDLASILAAWGDAVPPGIPPSDCPLNLINP